MQPTATKESDAPPAAGSRPPARTTSGKAPLFSRYDALGIGLALSIVLHWGGGEQQMYSVVLYMVPAFILVGLSIFKAKPLFRRARWAAVPVGAALFMLVWGIIAAAASGAPQVVTIFGEWGRADGLLNLLACIAITLAVATAPWWAISRMLAWVIAAGGIALVIGYLSYYAGIDLVSTAFADRNFAATFGNPNFSAGFFATTGVLALFLILTTRNRVARAALLLYAVGTGFSLGPNGSLQGPLAYAAGVAAGLIALLLMIRGRLRVAGIIVSIASIATGLALAVITLAERGPLGAAFYADSGIAVRRLFWDAAFQVAAAHPIFGVGPDGFSRYVAQYRSDDYVSMLGLLAENAVHSVPLHTMVGYGLPGLLAWIVVFVGTLVGLLLFLAKLPATSVRRIRWTGAAVVAGLTAYIAQASVSIDFYSLKATGWFLAGAGISLILRSREAEALSAGAPDAPAQSQSASTGRILGLWGLGLAVAVASVLFVGWWSGLTPKVGTITPDQARAIATSSWVHCTARTQWLEQLRQAAPEKVPDPVLLMRTDPRCYPFTSAAASAMLETTTPEASEIVDFYATVDPKSFVSQAYLAQHRMVVGDVEGARAAQAEMNRLAAMSKDVDQDFVARVNEILEQGYSTVATSVASSVAASAS